jgi:5-(carboxyamino)imidazole ribonucleotide mutase
MSDTIVLSLPATPVVGVIMGSQSDWDVMKHASDTLEAFGILHECEVVSAHRTPDKLFDYAESAASRGFEVIIAGAGGAAHLPGMCAAKTHLPVLGVPVAHDSSILRGQDALLSIVQMPAGIPVGTLAIGKAGATNAALLAAAILANKYPEVRERLIAFRINQTQEVMEKRDPRG